MRKIKLTICGVLIILSSCYNDSIEPPAPVIFSWDFASGTEGWAGDFADYPVGREESFDLLFDHTTLPEPLNENSGALLLTGTNLSDDLFMFMKQRVTGLEPNTRYNTLFTIEFASDVPDDTPGIGGSPGESVFIKAGATQTEPGKVTDENDYYRMNIDKGGQSQGGEDMVVIGDFSNDTNEAVYTLKTVENEELFEVTSDQNGELWVIVGTDSGFEGNTAIYYNNIRVEFYE
jgi:hypothetical protein